MIICKRVTELFLPVETLLGPFNSRTPLNSLGVTYTIIRELKTNFAIGAQGTIYAADTSLDAIYGQNAMSAEIYLLISPTLMNTNMSKVK